MTKLLPFIAILAMALAFVSCSNQNNSSLDTYYYIQADSSQLSQKVGSDTLVLRGNPYSVKTREELSIEKNKMVSKSQEVPVGKENFEKLVAYIWKHGFTTTGGPNEIPCGKQFTFFDSKGNRHAYLAIKTDTTTNQASMTGKVQDIVAYCFRKGIKDLEHYIPYYIDTNTMRHDGLELDGPWKGVEDATFGYKEFLAKVSK